MKMKMKTQFLAMGALMCALTFTPAHSAEVFKSKAVTLDVYGHLSVALYGGKHDRYDADSHPSTIQFRADGIVGIDAYSRLPNGYKLGALLEVELYTSIETFYAYFSGPFGKLLIGQADNASSYLNLYTPAYLAPGIATLDWTDFEFNGRTSVNEGGTGLQLGNTTFFVYDDVALQVVYLSPSIQGFSFGVSWTPDPCVSVREGQSSVRGRSNNANCGKTGRFLNPDGSVADLDTLTQTLATANEALTQAIAASTPTAAAAATATQRTAVIAARSALDTARANTTAENYVITQVVTVATQFARQESFGLDWGISSSFITGERARANNMPFGYSVGLNLRYAGFEIGGAWQHSNNFNDSTIEDKVWTAGFAYSQENWRVGSAYRQSQRRTGSASLARVNREVEVGLSYELGRGFWTSIAFELVWDKNPENQDGYRSIKSYGGTFLLSYAF